VIEKLAELYRYFPTIPSPKYALSLKEKILWSVAILVVYFLMMHTVVIGVKHTNTQMDLLSIIVASRAGTLLTLGIGPIIIASLLLQLLIGGGVVNFKLDSPEKRKIFAEAQVVVAVILALIQAYLYAYGAIGPTATGPYVSEAFYGNPITMHLVALQIVLGAIFVIYLDQISTKYGLTSGISLFIAAGVSYAVVSGALYILFNEDVGIISQFLKGVGIEALQTALVQIIPLITTAIAIYVITWIQSMKVSIPLTIMGQDRKIELPFFYLTTIPVIFASIFLLMLYQLGLSLLQIPGEDLLAQIARFIGAILYVLGPLPANHYNIPSYLNTVFSGTVPVLGIPEWLHLIIHIIVLGITSMIFGVLWAETMGQDGKSLAKQLRQYPQVQVQGYRRDPRILEKKIVEYVDPLIKLSSLVIGLLAGIGDALAVLGTGTGILLTISIYERMLPQIREAIKIYAPQLAGLLGEKV